MSINALCVLWDNLRQLGSLYTVCLIRNIITDNPALSTVSLIYGGRGVSLCILSQNSFNNQCIVAMYKTLLIIKSNGQNSKTNNTKTTKIVS